MAEDTQAGGGTMKLQLSERCPSCGSADIEKVIYAGLPARFCVECTAMWGFWSWVIMHLPFNGRLFCYRGNYLSALIRWLQGPPTPWLGG